MGIGVLRLLFLLGVRDEMGHRAHDHRDDDFAVPNATHGTLQGAKSSMNREGGGKGEVRRGEEKRRDSSEDQTDAFLRADIHLDGHIHPTGYSMYIM